MNALHDSTQNIAKLRGLVAGVRRLDVLKNSTDNEILKNTIEDTIVLAEQASDALDALELTCAEMPSFRVDTK